MAISRDQVDEIKSRVSIIDVAAERVNLSRHGSTMSCCCPFHQEKTPSCVLYEKTNSFYCFGCGTSGDVISFIRGTDNLSYVEAVQQLAQRAGITIDTKGAQLNQREQELRDRIRACNREAARYFFRSLTQDDAGGVGRAYLLNERGLSMAAVRHFGLGYAKPESFGLVNYLRDKGFTDDEMITANLAYQSKTGHVMDRFRDRIMYPIFDTVGNVIAFGGRALSYAAWQADKEGKPNRRKALREDIDRILANENIESLEAFYDTLRAYGYAVMTDQKYVAICPPGGERNIRLQSLGENYEPEALHLRILRIKADRLLGKTKVIEQPMTPKRKMRLRGTVRRKSKAHGIRALYYKWLYYLGVFKRRPKVYGSAFTTARWQLNAYIKQFDYVAKYNLKTRDDVEQRLRVVQHEISGQIDEREEVRTVLRCLETGDAEIQEQLEKIEKINAQLKKLRSEAKLCVQILEQQPQIKSKIEKAHEVKTFETERGKENGRTSDHHLEHRRNEAAPTREQRSSGGARSSDPIQRR